MAIAAVGLPNGSIACNRSKHRVPQRMRPPFKLCNSGRSMTNRRSVNYLVLICALALGSSWAVTVAAAENQLLLRDVCRLKGQEENTLQA